MSDPEPGLKGIYAKEVNPPISIESESRQILLKSGISEERLNALTELARPYDYNSVLEKLKALTKNPIYISPSRIVAIPDFFYGPGTRTGQCADIAIQFTKSTEFDQWILETNQDLEAKGSKLKLSKEIWDGQSKDFFNQPNDTHICSALNIDGISLVIDPSMGVIGFADEIGYQETNIITEIEKIDYLKTGFVGLGVIEQGSNLKFEKSLTLGISTNKQYIYGLAFLEDAKTNQIVPVIQRMHKNGYSECFILVENEVKSFYVFGPVDEEAKLEILEMLTIVDSFKYTDDPDKFAYKLEL